MSRRIPCGPGAPPPAIGPSLANKPFGLRDRVRAIVDDIRDARIDARGIVTTARGQRALADAEDSMNRVLAELEKLP